MGEFVKQVLDERHINGASVARAMRIQEQSFPSYFRSKVMSDDVLRKMSNALKFDLLSIVREEEARRTQGPVIGDQQQSMTSDPAGPAYAVKSGATTGRGMELTLYLDDYPEDVQLQLLRFVQQLPRRNSGHRSALG